MTLTKACKYAFLSDVRCNSECLLANFQQEKKKHLKCILNVSLKNALVSLNSFHFQIGIMILILSL